MSLDEQGQRMLLRTAVGGIGLHERSNDHGRAVFRMMEVIVPPVVSVNEIKIAHHGLENIPERSGALIAPMMLASHEGGVFR